MLLKEAHEIVVGFMHYDGTERDQLTSEEFWEVYCLGDGFGKCSSERLKQINGGYDWSHIRDSTPQGWYAMAERILAIKKDRLVAKLVAKQKEAVDDWQRHHYREIALGPALKGH